MEETIQDNVVKISKHKIKGKHSLKYDSIFKGKKDEDGYDDSCYLDIQSNSQNFDTDVSSSYHFEKENPYEYNRRLELENDVKRLVTEGLGMNILANRRRPSKVEFNKNFKYLVNNLDPSKYSLGEIFVTYSVYFSENLANMFKILDNEWRDIITDQLHKKSNNNIVKNIDKINFE